MTSSIAAVSSDSSSPDCVPDASIQKSFSCVVCAQRKVKCDKAPGGCSNCTKARITCVYKAPALPRRRKKGMREMDVYSRMKLYEDALRRLGVDPLKVEQDELSKGQLPGQVELAKVASSLEYRLPELVGKGKSGKGRSGKTDPDAGVLVSGEGKSWYIENGLWTHLRGAFRDSKELLDDSSDDDEGHFETQDNPFTPEMFSADGSSLLFGTPKSAPSLRHLHPQPVQIFQLWQKYLENVDFSIKVFHTPTIQKIVLDASGNLNNLPKTVEALLFAIYAMSVTSLSDAECHTMLGEPKSIVGQRFRSGAQHALVNANFLKTADIMVLQAFVLFLLSLQNFDGRVVWILTGIAGRIAQRLGLHRDGESLGLPPFEVQIRRKLWWQIIMMDGFAQKLAGIGGQVFVGDTKLPLNLNDSDFFLEMTEPPKEHDRATEMMFFLMRGSMASILTRFALNPDGNFDGVWNKLTSSAVPVSTKDKALDELEELMQRRFLQYCDRSVPWQAMCLGVGRAGMLMMRFMAHNPEQYVGTKVNMPQSEKDSLFDIALEVISQQNSAYVSKDLQRFVWHINMHFQWKAFIYLVSELRTRNDDKTDEAWKQVQLAYENHPTFTKEFARRALPVAIGNVTLRAWDAHIAARGVPSGGEPNFIQMLRAQRTRHQPRIAAPVPVNQEPAMFQQPNLMPSGNDDVPNSGFNANDPLQSFQWDTDLAMSLENNTTVDFPPVNDAAQMDWSTWNNLLVDFQSQGVNVSIPIEAPDFRYHT